MGSCHSSSPVPTDTEASVSLLSEQTLMNSQLSVAPSSHLKDPTCAPSTSDTPTSSDGSLTLRNVDIWEEDASKDPRAQLSRTVLQHTDFEEVLRSHQVMTEDRHIFNHQLKLLPRPVTNQKSSGRCWLFATTNVVRYGMMKKLRVVDFELSQAYLSFWDKLQKCNRFLEHAIKKVACDGSSEECDISKFRKYSIKDGGDWDMAADLLEKYGVVPSTVFPESYASSKTKGLNKLLTTKIKAHALEIYALHASLTSTNTDSEPSSSTSPDRPLSRNDITLALRVKKEELLTEIWSIMTATLGVPPRPDVPFTYQYYDKHGDARSWTGTPVEFYKRFRSKKYHPGEWVQISNDPRYRYKAFYKEDKPAKIAYGYTILKPWPWINAEIGELKAAIVRSIKSGHPAYVTCDIDQFSDNDTGIMDATLHQYQSAFNIAFNLSKAERIDLRESHWDHAVVISGVHLDGRGRPVRYKVENSWGDSYGNDGYYVMTDAWFDEFVYDVAIPKSLAPKKISKMIKKDEKKQKKERKKK